MARLSREFVKLETRILNDHRFFTMTEFEQLVFIKLLGISRSTSNKIPKDFHIIAELLRLKKGETCFYLSQIGFSKRDFGSKSDKDLYEIGIKSAIRRIKLNFPKFKENKYFYYFDGYELRMNNSAPKVINNSCVDEDIDKDEDKDINSEKYKLSEFFLSLLKNRKPDFKTPNLKEWAKDIDLMVRIDHREPARIKEVMEWCQRDEFWQNNILSTYKLRKQFDRLELQMQKKKPEKPEGASGRIL